MHPPGGRICAMPQVRDDFLDRLASKFTVGDGCWEWTAGRNAQGYGHVMTDDGRMRRAHRVIYELLVGSSMGVVLDHRCRNRGCVRPDHLDPVTQRENLRRSASNGGVLWDGRTPNGSRTECQRGHRFDDANTYIAPNGSRRCRACRLSAKRRFNHRQKHSR